MQPLIATNYAGVELLLIVPLLAVVALTGFICVSSRARVGALICGILSIGIGALCFRGSRDDIGCGIAAVAVGALLCWQGWRARPKKPKWDPETPNP